MFDEFSSHLAPLVQMLKKDQKVSQKVWLVHFTELSHNWNQQWERETKRMMHSETKTSLTSDLTVAFPILVRALYVWVM